MSLDVVIKNKELKTKDGLSLAQIQKIPGIFCNANGICDSEIIVNVLGNKSSCFYVDSSGTLEAVDWDSWKNIVFKKAQTEITLSNPQGLK